MSEPENHIVRLAGLIRELGTTTIVIVVFLGMFTGWIDSPMTETAEVLKLHITATQTTEARYEILMKELVKAQRASCIVTARTENQRQVCLE